MIKRILPCVMALIFVLALPSVALAVGGEPKVNWSEDGDTCRIWITRNNTPDYPCENQYDAASWMLGVNPARLTDEQKTKLSNESSGGQFWVFAQAVEGSTGDDLDLSLFPGLPSFYTIYGNYYYAVECDKSLFYAAQNDLHVILSGGSLGGGGSSGDYYSFTGNVCYASRTFSYYSYYSVDGTKYTNNLAAGYSTMPSQVEVRIPREYIDPTWGDLGSYGTVYCILQFNKSGSVACSLFSGNVSVAEKQNTLVNTDNYISYLVANTSTSECDYCVGHFGSYVTDGNSVIISTYSSDFKKQHSTNPHQAFYAGVTGGSTNSTSTVILTLGGGGGGGGSDTFWPSPTGGEPDPPTPPEPGDPVSPEPDPPTPPDLPDPYMPTVEPEPTGTEPIDYTPWLRAILRELQNFHRDNIAVLNSINSQIVSSSNALIADLNYMLDYGLGQLKNEFSATRSYLRECLEWLAEQMDFSFTAGGYDDTSVVSYLKQILYELQKAPDVTTDPFDFFGWLNGLLGNLLSGLLGAVLGSLASFTEPLEALTGKFPFSLPWDIAAILALFVAPAQVPIFDIPFAGYGSVHVDLTGFDVVAQVVRALMLVLFAYGLTQRTKDMLDLIDKIVG